MIKFGICPTRYIPNLVKLCENESQGGEECALKAKEAVAQRILQLCEERNLTVNMLATESGVPPSSVYSMLNQKSKNPGVVSLKKLCDGLGITLRFFFDSDLFDDLEQEIQ